MSPPLRFGSDYRIQWLSSAGISILLTIFSNVSPLPCSHPDCNNFFIHLKFEKVEKVYKVEKVHSSFYTFHTILIFMGREKMTGYLPFTKKHPQTFNSHRINKQLLALSIHVFFLNLICNFIFHAYFYRKISKYRK